MSFDDDMRFLDGLSGFDQDPDFDDMTFDETVSFVGQLSAEEKRNMLESMKDKQPSLLPLAGPQTMACESQEEVYPKRTTDTEQILRNL